MVESFYCKTGRLNNVLLMLHKFTPQKSVYLGSGIESHSWAQEPQVRLGRRDPGLYCWKDVNMKCAASGLECGITEGYVQGTFQLLDPGGYWAELLDHRSPMVKPFLLPLAPPRAETVLGCTLSLLDYLQN